jgi:cellulose synthase/poly-beta-1,6-N-acetylglucosamine synthase-like glycosyltransferase
MNTHSFTYIIGYRHNPDRFNNLRKVLDWINGFANVDVILIEQDKHSKISHLPLKARHIFLKSDRPYNKSWAFNVAVKESKSDIIIFADSDLIMNPNDFMESIKLLEQYEMVNPYSSVIDLQPQESNLGLEQILLIDRPGRGETDHQKVPLCGGICIFRKSAILRIGGWNESFMGWGAEDDFISHKVKNFLSWTESKNKCYHLYHSRETPNMLYYQRNLQLLQQLTALSKEDLVKTVNTSVQKNGMKNLYDTF